jgi:hypothetical protein
MQKFFLYLVLCGLCLSLSLVLTSCGAEKNPILGEWEVEATSQNLGVNAILGVAQMFVKPFVKFTETEISSNIAGDMTKAITYRRDDDGTWYFCTEGGKYCEEFVFTDDNRNKATITLLGFTLNLRRVQPPKS